MTLPAQDIVERLRELPGREFTNLYHDAADTISRLTADNEALRTQANISADAIALASNKLLASEARADALAQEVERLRGLLGYNNGKRE